ncbi:MAG TPA: hypothetical protein VGD29_16420, partial [Actinoplanes sp.]
MTTPEAPGWRDIVRHLAGSARRSRRLRALRLLAETSPPLLVAAVIFVVAESVLPPFTLIVIGHVTGDIPGAV